MILSKVTTPRYEIRRPTMKPKGKTKSGCRTCKIRKVKCDLSDWPNGACDRCTNTGRTCDGYGIWSQRQTNSDHSAMTNPGTVRLNRCKAPGVLGIVTADERSHCEWFIHRTASKLPGLFGSAFWDTTVFQVAYTEPAVLSAALALASTHRGCRELRRLSALSKPCTTHIDHEQRFSLRQYNKAIECLRPHFSTKGRAAVRIALVTCVLFICLDSLQTRYRSASKHLKHGMRLVDSLTDGPNDGIDQSLTESISILSLQAALLGQAIQLPRLACHTESSPSSFETLRHARLHLDSILHRILILKQEAVQIPTQDDVDLQTRQQTLRKDLDTYLFALKTSPNLKSADSSKSKTPATNLAHLSLQTYHALAHLLLSSCLSPNPTSHLLPHHLTILHNFIQIYTLVLVQASLSNTVHAHRPDAPPFTADRTFISPLFWVATKCPNARVRAQAIRLMEEGESMEVLWDNELAGRVAREVWRVEGLGEVGAGFELLEMPSDEELRKGEVVVDEERRVRDIQVVLPDGLWDEMTLICYTRAGTISRTYDPGTKTWRSSISRIEDLQ